MPKHTRGTTAKAWVENITLSLSLPVKRAKELEEFADRARSFFGRGEPLDVTTRRRMEAFFGYSLDDIRIHRGQGAEETSRRLGARAFAFRGHVFAPERNLDESTTEGLGLLAHELTHAIQQTQPHRLPQYQTTEQDSGPVPAAPPEGYAKAEMVLLAPARSSSSTTSSPSREAQALASEQLVAEASAE